MSDAWRVGIEPKSLFTMQIPDGFDGHWKAGRCLIRYFWGTCILSEPDILIKANTRDVTFWEYDFLSYRDYVRQSTFRFKIPLSVAGFTAKKVSEYLLKNFPLPFKLDYLNLNLTNVILGNRAEPFRQEKYAVLHHVLHEQAYYYDSNWFKYLIDEAPCLGNHDYPIGDPYIKSSSSNGTWYSENIFEKPKDPHGHKTNNGLDFMLFHNLVRLAHGTGASTINQDNMENNYLVTNRTISQSDEKLVGFNKLTLENFRVDGNGNVKARSHRCIKLTNFSSKNGASFSAKIDTVKECEEAKTWNTQQARPAVYDPTLGQDTSTVSLSKYSSVNDFITSIDTSQILQNYDTVKTTIKESLIVLDFVDIYPVPVQSSVNLKFKNIQQPGTVKVELFDLLGHLKISFNSTVENDTVINLNVQNLVNGMYNLKITGHINQSKSIQIER